MRDRATRQDDVWGLALGCRQVATGADCMGPGSGGKMLQVILTCVTLKNVMAL